MAAGRDVALERDPKACGHPLDDRAFNQGSQPAETLAVVEVDGPEAALRAIDDGIRDIPVVLVTSLSDPLGVIRGLECGADNFIGKPLDARDLLARIEHLLTNLELRRSLRAPRGVEVSLHGRRYLVTSKPRQILDLLISTYEEAVHLNGELAAREESLARSNQVIQGLFRITEGLNQAREMEEVAGTVVERAMELPGVQAGWIALREGEAEFRQLAARNLPPALAAPGALDGPCGCRRKLLAGELDGVTNMQECERLARADGDTRGLTAHVSVPIWIGEEVLGILNLAGGGEGLFDESDAENLHAVGHQLGIAIARARLHEGLERQVAERTAGLAAEVEERKRAQAEQARLVAILEATPDFVGTAAPDGRVLYINEAGRRLVGLGAGGSSPTLEIASLHPEWASRRILGEGIPHAIRHGSWSGETALLRRDGTEIPALQVIIAHRGGDGGLEYLSTIARDISPLKAQESRILRLSRVHALLSGINTTIVRMRSREELFAEACRIAIEEGGFRYAWIGLLEPDGTTLRPMADAGHGDGYLEDIELSLRPGGPLACDLVAEALQQLEPVVCNDVAADRRRWTHRARALERGYRAAALLPLVAGGRPAGLLVLYAPEVGAFDDEEMRLLAEMAGDIAFALDHLEKEARIEYLAYYDEVTGLPNRTLFWDRVRQRIRGASPDQEMLCLAVLDLERFRAINDTLGREAGDGLLRCIGERLAVGCGRTGIVARLGADHFGLALRCGPDPGETARALEGLLAELGEQPFAVGELELRISARAGVARFPADGTDVEELHRNAEAALRQAKLAMRPYSFYTPELNARVAESLRVENRLREAVQARQFLLHYHPKVDVESGRVTGMEALLRWNDPDAGPVPPATFIPVLEATGMILDAGRWVVEEALAQSARWRRAGLDAPRIAVNVSALQLREAGFVAGIERALAAAPGGLLDLEITESLIMEDVAASIEKLQAVRELGVEISIDDFGTGYSSLSYIARLPVQALKIDREFIRNMERNAEDRSVVSTIISLAHSLGLRVIAEGVETQAQACLLHEFRCDEMQGFLVCPPLAPERIAELLRGRTGP